MKDVNLGGKVNKNMKKILLSVSIIAAVAAVVFGITTAFFSDTETSTGNTFTAGAIDLKIDNTSYRSNDEGVMELQQGTTWELSDLPGHLFFNFSDLKPGDRGEDTVSIHVYNNDAWACVAFGNLKSSDNGCTEPELEAELGCENDGEGELAKNLDFVFWADMCDETGKGATPGDNKFTPDCAGDVIIMNGLASDVLNGKVYPIADNTFSIVGNAGTALTGSKDYYIGKMWCFGDLTWANNTSSETWTCNGQSVGNEAQTDRLTGDIQFYAVQSRNNPNFLCSNSNDWTPKWPSQNRSLLLENKSADWQAITGDGIRGFLTYNTAGEKFDYTFQATGLQLNTLYALIYYADQNPRFDTWGGKINDSVGRVITTFTTDGSGNIPLTGGSDDLGGIDLPESPDWNISPDQDYCDYHNTYDDYDTCTGAKIWLVPTSALTSGNILPVIVWAPSTFLFETDLIHYDNR